MKSRYCSSVSDSDMGVTKHTQSYSVTEASAPAPGDNSVTSNNVNVIQHMLQKKSWSTLSINLIETIFYK